MIHKKKPTSKKNLSPTGRVRCKNELLYCTPGCVGFLAARNMTVDPWTLGALGFWTLARLFSSDLCTLGPLDLWGPWTFGHLQTFFFGTHDPWTFGPLDPWALGTLDL